MASLERDERALHRLIDGLLLTLVDTGDLELKFQKLIAETAMLRLFYGLENAVANVSHKLLMNTAYCDTPPTRPVFLPGVAPFRRLADAETAVIRSRGPRARYTKWTQLSDVQANLAAFLDPTDHFLAERANLDFVFEDMRKVRNHIAHNTRSTATAFASVVARIYPLQPRGITPGKLLLSQRQAFAGAPTAGQPAIIVQYLRWTKVAITKLAKH